jgi:glycosyltransferase involved in cell wall biosynthesis
VRHVEQINMDTVCVPMNEILVVIVSWNRPEFLRRTCQSLFPQLDGVSSKFLVVDNGSDEATRNVIEQEVRIDERVFLGSNLGLNRALEAALPRDLARDFEYLLISDADMEDRRPIRNAFPMLQDHPMIGAVSFQHSPEHPAMGEFLYRHERWIVKRGERGCSVLFRTRRFQELRPLPLHEMLEFDWWAMRDSPQSLQSRNEFVAVCPGAAIHLGWRAGDSTWQSSEIPEFDEFRV